MRILSSEVSLAFQGAVSAGTACFTEAMVSEATAEMFEELLDAVMSGDYSEFAAELAGQFWELQTTAGAGAAVHEYRQLFAVLVEKCPALREPLQKALDEGNPVKDLLPPTAPPEAPKCGSCGPCDGGSGCQVDP